MFKNNFGFTFLESILSLSFILLLTITLFPLLFNMLNHLSEEKKELTAYRLLFEYVENQITMYDGMSEYRTVRNMEFELTLSLEGGEGGWSACVYYEEQERCIKQ